MADINLCFVSQKISKVKWRPVDKSAFQRSDIFASGSWDNEENKVSLWKINLSPTLDETLQESVDAEPQLLCDVCLHGDVMGLDFVSPDRIISTTSTGSAVLFKYHTNSQSLGLCSEWKELHHFGSRDAPCTCVTVATDSSVATAGEDGRINIINLEQKNPTRIIDDADSCSINDLVYLRHRELLLVSSSGQLKLVDVRQADHTAKIYCVSGEDRAPLQCVACHPMQPHIVATGGGDGMLCVWDLRQDRFPINPLQAHKSTLWQIKFHPDSPDNLFTCSEDGSVWHWDGTNITATTPHSYGSNTEVTSYACPWLQTGVTQQRLQVKEVIQTKGLSVNCVDVQSDTLICGSDNEALYTMRKLVVR